MAILSFRDAATEDINDGHDSKTARRRLPRGLHDRARIKLARLHAAAALSDLSSLPGNRLEKLAGDRSGQFGIRLNDRYRICFVWTDQGDEQVEIVDYH